MYNEITVKSLGEGKPILTGNDLIVGQFGKTRAGFFVIRSENRVIFLGDGTSHSGNLDTRLEMIFPVGTVLEIKVQR